MIGVLYVIARPVYTSHFLDTSVHAGTKSSTANLIGHFERQKLIRHGTSVKLRQVPCAFSDKAKDSVPDYLVDYSYFSTKKMLLSLNANPIYFPTLEFEVENKNVFLILLRPHNL